MKNQTRQSILEIYNAYFEACNVICQAGSNLDEVFVSDQNYYNWAMKVENSGVLITRMYNQAKLMVEDDKFIKNKKY